MKQKILILLFATLVGTGLTQASVVIDGIAYVINETKNVAAVTSGGTYTGEVVIPATITYNAKPYSVVSIDGYAFYNCSSLTSIEIPNSVTVIGDSVFSYCSKLTAVNISDIAAWCNISFYNYYANPLYYAHNLYLNGTLVTDLVIPNSVTSIKSYAFSGCYRLTSVTIPNSVTSIGYCAFEGCSSLTSITIPNSVTSIEYAAFSGCSNLTSITIPNSVTSIGYEAFRGCISLTSVTIPNSVTSIGGSAFQGCSKLATVIWNAKKCNDFSSSDTPFYYYESGSYNNFDLRKQITSFTFGDNVESIPAYLCSGMSNLTSITIPNSVTSIGVGAIRDCSSLTSVTIPESVTSIGQGATFQGCTSLVSVQWNAKSCTIEKNENNKYYPPFHNLSSINDFTFGDKVETIPACLCTGLSGFTSIEIPNSVTSIEYKAFYDCSSLTSVTIPNSVTSIGDYAFPANAVQEIHFTCTMEEWFTKSFNPNRISSSYTLFINGEPITNLVIPNSVTSIAQGAFYGCSSLKNVSIASSVKVLEDSAFYNCTNIETITCYGMRPPTVNTNALYGLSYSTIVYVPADYLETYKMHERWGLYDVRALENSGTEPATYTITWQDEDGNVIKTDQVVQDATPAFTGTTPTKEGYTFAGWLPNIKPATEDTKYTTYFIPTQQQESKVYTVNINGENCSLNINNQYPEGTVITLEAVADECFEFRQWSDGNKENPRTVTVTANTNLTAEFNKVRYTVTGEPSTGGKVQIHKQ